MTQQVRRSISDRLPRSSPADAVDAPTFDAAVIAATAEPDIIDHEVVQPEAIAIDGGPAPVARREPGRLGRFVGVLIASISIGAALVLWAIVSARTPELDRAPRVASFLGRWEFSYDPQVPAIALVLGAVGLGLLFAAAAAMVERVVLDKSRRSTDATTKLLAPKIVMAETRGVFAGPVTVTVLIPAHNEAASIGATLSSLAAQEPAPIA